MSDETYDSIVVGGGLAGLTAATFLARAGRRVAVYERADGLGGRAATRELDGFHFNLGPHALYAGSTGMPVLKELDADVIGRSPTVNGGFAVRNAKLHTLPAGPLSLLVTGLLPLSAKLEVGSFLARLSRLDASSFDCVTVDEWVEARFASNAARDFVRALVRLTTYVNASSQMSAGCALTQLEAATRGVLYLDGGWQRLVDSIRMQAQEAGAEIVTRQPARRVIVADRANGVELDEGRARAAQVLLCVGPLEAAGLAPASARLAKEARTAVPVEAACLDVALAELPRPRALFALGIDAPLYASVHSAAAKLAPPPAALIHVARYGTRDAKSDAESMNHFLDLLQPGWRERVVHQRVLPRMRVSNALVTARRGGLAGRPGVRVPDVAGLFVAGDWVGPHGLLADASLSSARAAARSMLEEPASVARAA